MITNVFDVLGTMAFEHNFGGIIMGEVVFENGNGKVNGGGDSPDEHGQCISSARKQLDVKNMICTRSLGLISLIETKVKAKKKMGNMYQKLFTG